jgi:transglutaminase-like putative cysteine protease
MIYDIRHITTYRYDAPVSSARCTLRLLPADDGGQRVFDSGIEIAPNPSSIAQRVDFFGTRVAHVTIETAHRELRITALSRVEVERREPPAAALTPPWEEVREAAFASAALGPRAPGHFLYPSRLIPLHEPATAYAEASFRPGRPVVEAAAELMQRIRADFKYDPKATAVTTPLSEAFAARGGVCQDFAQIMIAGLRGVGLPAAYVSGYIRTIPPAGKPRLVGADASHAWASLWCGEIFGWLDFDPTNATLAGNDHIVIARGRDYADVSPIDGVILASGKQTLAVSVDVAPSQRQANDPPPLAPELV